MKQPQAMGRGAYLYQPQLQQAHGDGDPRGSCRIREKQRALQQPDPTAREWRRAAEVSVWGMTKHHRALPLGRTGWAWRGGLQKSLLTRRKQLLVGHCGGRMRSLAPCRTEAPGMCLASSSCFSPPGGILACSFRRVPRRNPQPGMGLGLSLALHRGWAYR